MYGRGRAQERETAKLFREYRMLQHSTRYPPIDGNESRHTNCVADVGTCRSGATIAYVLL